MGQNRVILLIKQNDPILPQDKRVELGGIFVRSRPKSDGCKSSEHVRYQFALKVDASMHRKNCIVGIDNGKSAWSNDGRSRESFVQFFKENPMPKYFLPQIVCACLLVFSVPSPCVGQNPEDHDVVVWNYPFTMDWGYGNEDISIGLRWGDPVLARDRDLSGRDLRNARIHLEGGILHNFNFNNANLEGADFTDTILENCSFQGANLRHAGITVSPDSDMTGAILGGGRVLLTQLQMQSTWNSANKDIIDIMILDGRIRLEDLRWDQLPLKYKLSGEHVFRTHEFQHKSLHGLTISRTHFIDSDFSGFTLGLFEHCNFRGANFRDAVILKPSAVPGLGREPFGFRACIISKEQMEQMRFWKEHDLRGIILEGIDMEGWDFSNKDLSNASLKNSVVRNANFENAVLYNTDFSFSLYDNFIVGGNLPNASITAEQLMQTISWKDKNVLNCVFVQVNFDNCDLAGINFSGTRFRGCSFKNANLTGAIMHFEDRMNLRLSEEQIRSLQNYNSDILEPLRLLPMFRPIPPR